MQQINLYQPIFRKQKPPMSAAQLLLGAGLLAGLLLGVSAIRFWQNLELQQQLQQARKQHAAVQARLAEVRQRFPAPQKDPKLAEQIKQLRQEINTKQQVLRILSGKSFGNTEGFVAQLTGLARQRIKGMWLTGMKIRAGGTQLDMQGNALRPELLPRYLQRLSNEPVFHGTAFDSFIMTRREQPPRWVEFALRSVDEKTEGR